MVAYYVVILLIFLTPLHASAQQYGLHGAMQQSSAGMKVQSRRMNIIAQNTANKDSAGAVPGAEPYRRKIIFFEEAYNPKAETTTVTVKKIARDYRKPLKPRYDPTHPAADQNGFVLFPNITSSIEQSDMREAQRSYEANINAMTTARKMYNSTVELLR